MLRWPLGEVLDPRGERLREKTSVVPTRLAENQLRQLPADGLLVGQLECHRTSKGGEKDGENRLEAREDG